MLIEKSKRLAKLPPYLFKEIDRLRTEAQARGVDIINVSIGDPDRPTPEHIVKAGQKAMADPANHRYPSYVGLLSFRQAVATWFEARFGVKLDPVSEVLALIGSKEAVAHLPLAFINSGDVVLCPNPAYPVYAAGTLFAGGEVHEMPLLPENDFFPDLKAIPAEAAARAKMMWLNYPNNPTSATATLDQFREAVDFALTHDIILCHDAAYTEMSFDGYRAPSILEVPGARECAVEIHSLSKTFQMTGWRIGMAVGNAEILAGLGDIKANIDSGTFQAVQEAAITALRTPLADIAVSQAVYSERRRVVEEGLKRLGLEVWPTKATFYLWARVPKGLTSTDWAAKLLKESGVVVTPGNGFGSHGEGWFRIALSVSRARLDEMIDRMERLVG